jgi:Ca-activated chloride channel homolog
MDFAQPIYFSCFIPLILLGLLLVFLTRRDRVMLARLGAPPLIAKLSATINRSGRRWRMILWLLALVFLIMALARPRWGAQVEYVERQGVEIMVVLDISESMLAADLKPSRLDRAKLEINELMDSLENNQLGLVLFSGSAFIQFPLTSDFNTARMFLDAAKPGLISRPGTALADAINMAINGFNKERASQKVIILLTDGEDHEGDVDAAVQKAAEEGIIIYTIGFGSPDGEPIPQFDAQGQIDGYKTDAQGQVILSRLDETLLQKIALTTNGRYYRAAADGREVGFLTGAISQLQTTQLESRFETRRVERFQWFLAVAIVALVIGELIPDRKGR